MLAFTAWSAPIFLLLGMALVFLISLVVRRQRHSALPTDPVCGKCGYIVRGISSLTCPECGSDLREVGIIPPGTRRPMGVLGWCVIWTLILPLPALFLSALAVNTLAPMAYTCTMQRTIFSQADYLNLTLHAEMNGRKVFWGGYRFNPTVPLQTLEINTNGGSINTPPLLDVDLATQVWTLTDSNGKTISKPDFDIEGILALLEAKGFDPSDPRIRDRAKDILQTIQELPQAQGKFTQLAKDSNGTCRITAHPTFASTSPQTLPWTWPIVWIFWLLIWLLGLLWIARSFRRKQQAPMEAQPVAEA